MLLIKNAKLTQKDGEKICDILIEDGKITKIQKDIKDIDCKTIDAKNKYLLPGIVDLNVNLKDSSFTLENIQRLQEKAKRSGVSSLIVRPDFKPKVENRTVLELLNEKLKDFERKGNRWLELSKQFILDSNQAIIIASEDTLSLNPESMVRCTEEGFLTIQGVLLATDETPKIWIADSPDTYFQGFRFEGDKKSTMRNISFRPHTALFEIKYSPGSVGIYSDLITVSPVVP
ncbi:MAG: hypothetical protein DSZ06_01770, partial [Sulfurospirillum sp.]